MNLSKLVVVVFLSACGIERSEVNFLTDNRTMLIYQQLPEGYRLLSCPDAIDLQISDQCVNVFLTADGSGEYLFSDTPQQPRLFAPSQDSVRKLMYIPIVVGSAVLTYLVVRKIRFRQARQAVSEYRPLKRVAEPDERFQTFESHFPTSVKDFLNNGQVFKVNNLQKKGGTSLADLVDKQPLADNQSATVRLNKIHEEIEKLDLALKESIDEFDSGQRVVIEQGFRDLQKLYGKKGKVAGDLASYRSKGDKHLNDKQVADFVKVFGQDVQRTDEVLSYFWELLGKSKLADKAHNRSTSSLVKERNADKRVFTDYLIAGISGLLSGAYLPNLLPSLDSHLLTAVEWHALFGGDKVYTVKDNRRVIEKLAVYLQSRGQPLVINDSLAKNQ